MPSQHSVEFKSSIPQHRFIEAVCHVLQGMGFRIDTNSPTFRQLIASDKRSNKVGHDNFRYEYQASVSWQDNAGTLQAQLVMSEREMGPNPQRCIQRCDEFLTAFHALIDRVDTQEPQSTKFGAARWATMEDIAKSPFLTPNAPGECLLLGRPESLCLTVPEEITYKHAAVIGPSGRGKSSTVFIPNIVERHQTSMIITEATVKERRPSALFKDTAGYREATGSEVYWFDPTLRNSTKINPLDMVSCAPPDRRLMEAQKLADILMRKQFGGAAQRIDHWDTAANLLLISLLLQVAEGIPDKKYRHIGTVRTLLRLGPDKLADVFAASPSRRAREEYETFYNNSKDKHGKADGHAKGVVSTLLPKLAPWVNEDVVVLTSTSDVTLEHLSKQLFTFYLSVPAKRQDLKHITALVFNYLLCIVDFSENFDYPLTFMLDEFTNFGYLPGFTSTLTTIRKSKISFLLGFQDQVQVENIYGHNEAAEILKNTTTKMFFQPAAADYEQAELVSKALGKTTITEHDTTPAGRPITREYGRYLLTPDEVLNMSNLPDDERASRLIVFTEGLSPIFLSSIVAPPALPGKFEWSDYQFARKYPVPQKPDYSIDIEDLRYPLPKLQPDSAAPTRTPTDTKAIRSIIDQALLSKPEPPVQDKPMPLDDEEIELDSECKFEPAPDDDF